MAEKKVKGITTKTYRSMRPPVVRFNCPDAAHIKKEELVRRQKEWEEENAEITQIRKTIRRRNKKEKNKKQEKETK